MDVYGDGIGDAIIVINPKDKGRVDPANWGGIIIERDDQKEGTVTLGRAPFTKPPGINATVDEADPATMHMTVILGTIQAGTTATISEDGLVFTLAAGKKLEIKNGEL